MHPAQPYSVYPGTQVGSSPLARRQLLKHFGGGLGALALTSLFGTSASASDGAPLPSLPQPHHPPRAKRCIWLFMGGGPSHFETFDPKPKLIEYNRKQIPIKLPDHLRDASRTVMAPMWGFKRYGNSGLEVSDLLPHLGSCADDLCVVRSLCCDNIDHQAAITQMTTGEQSASRPSLGSWLLYGLGSENQNLPGFVALAPNPSQGIARPWSAAFLPAAFQGTHIKSLAAPISDIKPILSADVQRQQLDLIAGLNQLHGRGRGDDSRLEARTATYELAFRMQSQAPDAFNVDTEPATMKKEYGLDDPVTEKYGRMCLLARRLVERGVRFVHVDCGNIWDHHGGALEGHPKSAAATDLPCAALIKDLKASGLLKDTLVIWAGEFGRTPTSQGSNGRDHHPHGFTAVFAGGGVKGGMTYGATDDFGWYAVQDRMHVHDFHATILHLMGLDHEKLTYRYAGRDYRLTDVAGTVAKAILA
ncbi:sulfatase [Planctomycetota bacterium]|nr:sulfatase [Planctomycetota bacterium]